MSFAFTPEPLRDIVDAPELSFPLTRRYRRRVLPIMALLVGSVLLLTTLSVRQAVRETQLELAAREAAEIAAEMRAKAPSEWRALISERASAEERGRLAALFAEVASDRGLPRLKLHSLTGEVLFSTEPGDIGQLEDNAAVRAAAREGGPVLLPNEEGDGTRFSEFFIPVEANSGDVALVMELYEPADKLRTIFVRALVLPILVPGLLSIGLIAALGALIRRAQLGIDVRASRVRELGVQLERFISSSAVWAVRTAPQNGDTPLQRIEVSLLYSDVRRFTDFSESASPEEVVGFLNRVMTVQAEFVATYGGEFEPMVGDVLLARFEGDEKEWRATAAALDIQTAVERARFPRGLGIGVFTGPVISGPIGPRARRDHALIGDSVNIAARLSAKAKRGEIIADARTLARSTVADRFGPIEEVKVRGRGQPIDIRRWSLEQITATLDRPAAVRGARSTDGAEHRQGRPIA
jgi:class 3 adenylate cyclase